MQVTWECYERLAARYGGFGLSQHSGLRHLQRGLDRQGLPARDGRAALARVQQDVPPSLLGLIMSSYSGGRSEVHLRRLICRVLYCDFRSMYPLGVGAHGPVALRHRPGHRLARGDRRDTGLCRWTCAADDLAKPETWRCLHVLVQVEAQADLLPGPRPL